MFCFVFGNCVFTAIGHDRHIQRRLEGNGVGWLNDAGFWGVAWAMIAAAAGMGLAAAAIAIFRSDETSEADELDVGYNALAPFIDL
jgi:hypothetical protein